MPSKPISTERDPTSSHVTVHDVARAAGVAIGTVSRVVNGAPTVSKAIRARVESAIAELGWTPSVAAQAMRGVSSHVVGFIFSDIRNPLYAAMVKGAEDVLSEHGYMLMIASSDGRSDREVALINLFKRRRADGLLFTVEEEGNAEVRRCIEASPYPVIMLEREMDAAMGSVGAAHKEGTHHATRYLLSLGHRRIALISGGRTNKVGRDRLAGFVQAHEQAGTPLDPSLLRLDSFASEYGFRETQLLLDMKNRPTAIVAAGMHLLDGVLRAIRIKGLQIPRDLSLIASNDSSLAELATPPIDVIRYDAYDLGQKAAQLLLHRMKKQSPDVSPRIEIPTEFILRESCAPPPKSI
ncbi:substrate-binding domain-containing protein [Achromobacter pestifer]|uniref:Substrate-binding domain-containing protein n=1 Tax=Achromobacter pestifer TaxID=1353889 RepID=A0A7D4I0Y7_9BURK|nr:substrate-binding domain-containing protein [Achromobacter pestifer]QKH37480.1 substrate-binding domain-containing protein [Achromobacter pestifer]